MYSNQKAIKDAKAGQVEIRNDKDGNIGLSIGRKSFEDDKLIKNYNAIIDALEKEKSNLTIKDNSTAAVLFHLGITIYDAKLYLCYGSSIFKYSSSSGNHY